MLNTKNNAFYQNNYDQAVFKNWAKQEKQPQKVLA